MLKNKATYEALILTGSNLGKPLDNLAFARERLKDLPGFPGRVSSVYRSEAWGFSSKNSFYNQALEVFTGLEPMELLSFLLETENLAGRQRSHEGYSDRILDMDILFIGGRVIETENLVVPHPRLHLRRFTLLPLFEIRPDFLHPVLKKTIRELVDVCPDPSRVEKVSLEKP